MTLPIEILRVKSIRNNMSGSAKRGIKLYIKKSNHSNFIGLTKLDVSNIGDLLIPLICTIISHLSLLDLYKLSFLINTPL